MAPLALRLGGELKAFRTFIQYFWSSSKLRRLDLCPFENIRFTLREALPEAETLKKSSTLMFFFEVGWEAGDNQQEKTSGHQGNSDMNGGTTRD